MEQQNKEYLQTNIQAEKDKRYNRVVLCLMICVVMSLMLPTTVLATGGTDIWTWADGAMKDVYAKIIGISTTVACCTASVALLVINFSSSNKAVDEARAWFKRILITWTLMNVLGFIMAYLQPLVNGGSTII